MALNTLLDSIFSQNQSLDNLDFYMVAIERHWSISPTTVVIIGMSSGYFLFYHPSFCAVVQYKLFLFRVTC